MLFHHCYFGTGKASIFSILLYGILFNTSSMLTPFAEAQQFQIEIDAGNQLDPSRVSKYMTTNDPVVNVNDPILSRAFLDAGLKHVRVYADFDFLIPVSKLKKTFRLDFRRYDAHIDGITNKLRAVPLIMLRSIPRVVSSRADLPDDTYATYPPINWADWETVVRLLVRHNVQKGLRGLYYAVWNEPELNGDWQGTYNEYITLYIRTARAVKGEDPSAKVGGPSANSWTIPWMGRSSRSHTGPFIKDFLSSIKEYNINNPGSAVPVDFISWHHYSPDYLSVGYKEVNRYVSQVGFPRAPEYLVTEWNSEYGNTAHPWNLKASFAVTNIIQQIATPQVWPFWFTFRIPKSQDLPTDYNSGLIANDDVNCKRPTYAAFQMMNAMTTGNFVSTSPSPELAVIATRDDQASKVATVVANYNPTNKSAKVSFTGLPFTTSSIKQKIQWIDNTRSMGCGGLEAGTVDHLSVKNKSISFGLNFPAYSIAQITLTSKR